VGNPSNYRGQVKFGRIYIVGMGVMGKLLHDRIFHFYTGNIVTFDKDDTIRIEDGTAEAPNLVIISTPISTIGNLVQQIADLAMSNTYITEIGSVKDASIAMHGIVEQSGNPSLFFGSTHPMVGPLAKDWHVLDWHRKCLILGGQPGVPSCPEPIAQFWRDLGFETHQIGFTAHDEFIGKLSHLSHFMIMMYVRYIHATMKPEEIALAGTSFETFSKMAEGAERLHDIYEANPYLNNITKEFSEFMTKAWNWGEYVGKE
jgi:prephenate dehydrogenase